MELLHVDKFLRFNMIFKYIECLNSLIRYDLRIYWMLNLPYNMSIELFAQSHIQSTLHVIWVPYCCIFQLVLISPCGLPSDSPRCYYLWKICTLVCIIFIATSFWCYYREKLINNQGLKNLYVQPLINKVM